MRNLILAFVLSSTSLAWAQEASGIVAQYLTEQGISITADGWRITREHVSSTSKIHHIYYEQVVNGIPLRDTESSIHISASGELLSDSQRFVKDFSRMNSTSTSQLISPLRALEAVMQHFSYEPKSEFLMVSDSRSLDHEVIFTDGGVSQRRIPAKLVYALDANDRYHLVWEVAVLEWDYSRLMVTDVAASNGQIVSTINTMAQCNFGDFKNTRELDYNANLINRPNYRAEEEETGICEVCYEVFALPVENPFAGERIIVQEPANSVASPFGWHDTDGEEGADTYLTAGNNALVIEKGDLNGYQTSGGERLDFTGFSFDPVFTEQNQYEDAALTNVFYWINVIHDVTFQYGFDEFSNNFQKVNNYSTTSASNDEMEARIQTRIGCNAFFANGIGGSERPIMVLGYCEDRDGAYDSVIIAHEYGHGIVNNLLGGSEFTGCLGNVEQMTEGWADFFGVLLTIKPSDVAVDRRPVGNFYFGQGPEGRGIRRYPYSTDMNVNPQTYNSIANARVPHGVGSVWGTMLWEMTWALIDVYGFDENVYNFTGDINQDAGNIMAMAIVIEGLKLMNCHPGFVDARDAILMANREIYGWESDCILYNAFARRGLGYFAEQGEPSSKTDGVEDFESYPTTAQWLEVMDICAGNKIVTGLEGGLPLGGVYSGSGIIDEGNGITFSVDTSITGLGAVEVTYEIGDTQCTKASSATQMLQVILDDTAPMIECPGDKSETVVINQEAVLPSFVDEVTATDACTENPVIVQDPEPFTSLGAGIHPVTLHAIDNAGNIGECVFFFEVLEIGDPSIDFETSVLIYPVPSQDEITIYNPSAKIIRTVIVHSIDGKWIKTLRSSEKGLYLTIPIDGLTAGNYFLTLETDRDVVVRRMIKQ